MKNNNVINARFLKRENISSSKQLTFWLAKSKLFYLYYLIVTADSTEVDIFVLKDLLHGKYDDMIMNEIPGTGLTLDIYFPVFQLVSKKIDRVIKARKIFNFEKINFDDYKLSQETLLLVLKLRLFEQYDVLLSNGRFTLETVEIMERLANGDFEENLKDAIPNSVTIDNCHIDINEFFKSIKI